MTCFARALFLMWVISCSSLSAASDMIPPAAWRRPIGQPLPAASGKNPALQNMIDDGYWQGAPVGGFGSGTLSRSYRGDFVRWHLKAGIHKYQSVPANQFSVFVQPAQGGTKIAEVLCAGKPDNNALSAWNWSYPAGAGEYASLYPKSWFDYRSKELPVGLVLEQFSPILPNNYREASYPVAVYNWHASNETHETLVVSIMFTWTNMIGWLRDGSSRFSNQINTDNVDRFRSQSIGNGAAMKGIVFDRLRRDNAVQEEWDGQFVIAAMESQGVEVSYMNVFRPEADGSDVWKQFSETGSLPNLNLEYASSGEQFGGAIAVRFTIRPGEHKTVPMVLAWDLPVIQFGMGRKWLRHYTDFFGTSGTHAWEIAMAGLRDGQSWSRQIDEWQRPYIADDSRPLWFRGMLFNEMYILADGGTVWAQPLSGPNRDRPPKTESKNAVLDGSDGSVFSSLECFDYLFYGTLDVRFYGSMPFIKFWPQLDKLEMREFAATVRQENKERFLWLWKWDTEHKFEITQRKVAGALPHDLGNPTEDPFIEINQYQWQSSSRWKDLNPKFVLLVWRDYALTGKRDLDFLRSLYPDVKLAMNYMRQFDRDDDGLIENDGYPDQTYDNWITRGSSAYSGGLYLAALRASEEIARAIGDHQAAQDYHALFRRAQASYVKKLWNGEYFDYDCESPYRKDVMADQLAGQWYANLTGLGDIVPPEFRRSALKKIFRFNVQNFSHGELGALNGMGEDGSILHTNEQVQEVWTGTTFALASEMLAEGMKEQAYATAKGIYNGVYERFGYWFRTPEAWGLDGHYRASMYMRPGAIWSMEMIEKAPNEKARSGVLGESSSR